MTANRSTEFEPKIVAEVALYLSIKTDLYNTSARMKPYLDRSFDTCLKKSKKITSPKLLISRTPFWKPESDTRVKFIPEQTYKQEDLHKVHARFLQIEQEMLSLNNFKFDPDLPCLTSKYFLSKYKPISEYAFASTYTDTSKSEFDSHWDLFSSIILRIINDILFFPA